LSLICFSLILLIGCSKSPTLRMIEAAEHGNIDSVRIMLEKGAKINERDKIGFTGLEMASLNGHINIVKLLLDNNAEINQINDSGWTPLMYAVMTGHIDIVGLLIDRGADPNLKSERGITALMRAANFIQPEAAKVLIEKGTKINEKNNKDETALYFAVHSPWENRPNTKQGISDSVSQRMQTIKILLNHGANYDWNLFHWAYADKDSKILQAFLEHDFNCNLMIDENGTTPLMCAIAANDTILINILLKKRADLNLLDKRGCNSLWFSDNAKTTVFLLSKGASANIRDNDGYTFLMLMSASGNFEIVKVLIDNGADYTLKSKEGKTALEYAKLKNNIEVVKLLQKAGTVQ